MDTTCQLQQKESSSYRCPIILCPTLFSVRWWGNAWIWLCPRAIKVGMWFPPYSSCTWIASLICSFETAISFLQFVEKILEEGAKSPRTIRLAALHLAGLWLAYPHTLKYYMKELKLLTLYGSGMLHVRSVFMFMLWLVPIHCCLTISCSFVLHEQHLYKIAWASPYVIYFF